MLKFFIPREMKTYQSYIRPEAAGDIIMVAEEDGVLKAVCGFYYTGNKAIIHQISFIEGQEDLPVLDGLFRTVMFHLMDMECTVATIMHSPEMMNVYLKKLGFEQAGGGWYSDHFPELLFSGCSGCGGYE